MRIPGIQNLLCIGGADGGNPVSALNGTLHDVDAVVIFQQVCFGSGNTQHIVEQLHAVLALILDIVNGNQGLNATIPVVVGIEQTIVNRNQSGLPVVGMNQIRFEIQIRQHFQRRTGQECKTLCVIIVAIQTRTLEVILVVDQIVNHAANLCLEHTAILTAPGYRDREAGDKTHIFSQFLRNILIERHHNTAADQPCTQGLGQGTRYITQTAGSSEGKCFTGTKQNLHRSHTFHKSSTPAFRQTEKIRLFEISGRTGSLLALPVFTKLQFIPDCPC